MILPQEKILVGVSGGPDSVALLYLLSKHKKKLKCSLHVAHLDHGLRGKAAEEDAKFVKALSKKLKIPFVSTKVDVGAFAKKNKLSVEDAGRRARHEFLEKTAKQIRASKIALGHTADDNVETFVMRIIRGSGTKGLLSISERRGKIIRPLIKIWKEDIEGYLKKNRIKARVDLSNYSQEYLRNKIRLKIIPELISLNPNFKNTILNTIDLLTADHEYLRSISEKTMPGAIVKRGLGYIKLDIDKLLMLPESILRYILRDAVEEIKGNLEEITYKHIASAIKKLREGKGFEIHLPERVFVKSDGDTLNITSVEPEIRKISYYYKLKIPGKVKIKESGYIIKASALNYVPEKGFKLKDRNEAVLDIGKTGDRFIIRNRKDGDKFSPLGMAGTQKLKEFFIDHKVPHDERDLVPIIEGRRGIAWVGGLRIDDHAKITDKTRKAVKLTLERGK